ncbi:MULTISPECIES: Rha family transcriptional regulator [Paenibacillus]|uniref:Rha family transcriptional regulator n=1 Tax=Paenibacillus TaxID=44249 RepID=UPI001C4DD022|nr:Rha family transcriptional regulator [Paenibacillus odorifer]
MTKLILNTECNLYTMSGKAYCSSKQVAEEFEKEHYNVIRDIENLDEPSTLRGPFTRVNKGKRFRRL